MDKKYSRKIISLDSSKRNQGTNNKPMFKLQYALNLKKGSIFRLSSANIPQSFYEVSSTLGNNSFEFEEDDGNPAYTVTISSGRYSPASLVNEIETKIAALLATATACTVSYDNITGLISFTSDGVIDISLNLSGNSGFARLIGFPAEDTGLDQNHLGTLVTQVNTIPYIYLRSEELTSFSPISNQHGLEGEVDLNLFRFDLFEDSFGRTIFNNLNKEQIFEIQGQIKQITLEFFDKDGNNIDFNGHNFIIDLEFLAVV